MSPFVLKACSIPKDYYSRGNVSRLQLIEESGVKSHLREFTIATIAECLEKHPDLIDACEEECEDIRGTVVWFFGKDEVGEYIVGFVGEDMEAENIEKFQGRTAACAEYIHRSVLSMLEM
jgi:hypothetical protein